MLRHCKSVRNWLDLDPCQGSSWFSQVFFLKSQQFQVVQSFDIAEVALESFLGFLYGSCLLLLLLLFWTSLFARP